MSLAKILMVLAFCLCLWELTFGAERKIYTSKPTAVIVAPDSLSPGYGQTDVPGWVRRSERETDPNIRAQRLYKTNFPAGKTSLGSDRNKELTDYAKTHRDVPGWVDPNIRAQRLYKTNFPDNETSLDLIIKKQLIDYAKTYLGSPYKYGGNNLSGIDCSGFVKNVYDKFGVKLPRTARQQYMMGTSIDREELSTGDLIFFGRERIGNPSHVGIFLEDGRFIHSSARKNGGVRVDSLNDNLYRRTFMGGRKLVE